jgi:hypothetical protein
MREHECHNNIISVKWTRKGGWPRGSDGRRRVDQLHQFGAYTGAGRAHQWETAAAATIGDPEGHWRLPGAGGRRPGQRDQREPVAAALLGLWRFYFTTFSSIDIPSPLQDLHSPPSGASSASFHRRVNAELARSLTPDQRELFRLYEPQMGAHIAAICSLIEEFFSLVEAHREPKLSFQKIQMVERVMVLLM